MKRSRKWVLLGVLALTLGAVVFWVDILHRADEAIKAHERAIVEEFSEMRRRPTLKELLLRRTLTHVTLHDLGEKGGLVDVPAGHWLSYGHDDDTRREIQACAYYWLTGEDRNGNWTPESILTCLMANQEVLREGGWAAWQIRWENRNQLLEAWKQLLISKPPTATELREVHEGFAMLEATEPRVEWSARIECLIAGFDAIRVLRRRGDPTHLFVRGPCWRELFSWRILVAKSLQQLRLDPGGSNDCHLMSLPSAGATGQSTTPWPIARTATAIALFHAEKGYYPDVLEELVPEYLREVPHGPDGAPLRLEDYFLDRPPGSAVPWDQWPLIRQ
jgi:hypothetical protein